MQNWDLIYTMQTNYFLNQTHWPSQPKFTKYTRDKNK